MSVYLPTVAWDTPNTRARCSGSARAVIGSRSTRSRRMRSKLTQVAHQRQSHPVAPLASPRLTGHQLGRDHFAETEGRSVRLAGARLTSQVLVQARTGRQAAIGKTHEPGDCCSFLADLGEDGGHRVLHVARKGERLAKISLILATVACWPSPPL
jgi:hypothetical protein